MNNELTAAEFFALMRSEPLAGNDRNKGLVRIGDAYVTPETLAEILEELA